MLGGLNMIINPIVNQTVDTNQLKVKEQPNKTAENIPQEEVKTVVPASDLLKAYNGVKTPQKPEVQPENQEHELTAYEYLNTLPNVKDTFKKELAEVAKVMERMDVESSNVEMMVNLVAEGKLWRGVLRYFCDNGKMSKPMEKDIDMMYGAYGEGKKPIDAYVPKVADKNAGLKTVKVGDTFEVEGEKNIYFKDNEGEAHQLKVSKETFAQLFPPAERFACTQGACGDCYLLSTLNSIQESPTQRAVLYDMFEETDDSVNVTMPNGEYTYSAPKIDLRQGIDKWQHMQGATGMILAEHTYGEELKHRFEKDFHTFMNSEIERMQKEEPQNTEKIEGYKQRLADFDEKQKDPDFKPVLMRFENPEANGKLTFQTDENGIMFKDLQSANKEYRRKLSTQADFYRGSIGGDLDVVMKDFGYKDIKEVSLKDSKNYDEVKQLLTPENNEKYIFTAGSRPMGEDKQSLLSKEYNIHACHAYKVEAFNDKDGTIKYYVENPLNATQNSILDFDTFKQYFEVVCAVKTE